MRSTSGTADRPLVHLGLFAATVAATFVTFLWQFCGWKSGLPSAGAVADSLAFSLCTVLILGAHEMGHYVAARLHKVDSSLPYFIPLPMLGFGTLGAVIRIRDRIPHRNALVDIGASGPIAGFLVALPVIAIGLLHSKVIPAVVQNPHWIPGSLSLWSLGKALVAWIAAKAGHPIVSAPVFGDDYVFGDSLLMVGMQRLVLGKLAPGTDLMWHPSVIAGWFGLLVTMMNLIPIGQLDGGHLAYANFGPRARTLGRAMAVALALLTLFCSMFWFLWLVVTAKVIGFSHPPVTDAALPLSPARRWVCFAGLLVLVLCFMPAPFWLVGS
jgi:membrane-associated protease RseP (regulator of RpoE activity)